MKYFFALILFCSGFSSFAQSSQAEYLEAKRLFSLKQYLSARQSFKTLTTDETFGAYASFYYALASYKLGEKKEAFDMWRQVEIKFPNWQTAELHYWLALSAFDLDRFDEGFRYTQDLSSPVQEDLLGRIFSDYTYDQLETLYRATAPTQRYLAERLIDAMQQEPITERDMELLADISDRFAIGGGLLREELSVIKKDTYAVAVALPFMYEGLESPQKVIKNSIIFDLYAGMKVAQQELSEASVYVELTPYDTKKSEAETRALLASGKVAQADVIVGPIYAGPVLEVSNYSFENKITMVNPISSTGEIVSQNPYAYLFKPSYQTQGKKAAAHAGSVYTSNKNVFIVYETDRDSLVAAAYKEVLLKDSFQIVNFERIDNERGLEIQKLLTEKYEMRLDTMYNKKQRDSIHSLPGRVVKERPLRNEVSGKIIKDRKGNDLIESYEELFYVIPDSIGHIFVASNSNLLANYFINIAEVRTDTVGIVGYDSWLDFSTISYEQLERLGVLFISPNLFDKETVRFDSLVSRFERTLGKAPNKYHLLGYELIWQMGQQLHAEGKYFQLGLRSGDFYEGKTMQGMQYGPYNDNQIVPITKLEQLQLFNQTPYRKEE